MGPRAGTFASGRIRHLLWAAVVLALIGSVGLAVARGRHPISSGIPRSALQPSALVGKPLPQLSLTDLDGHTVLAQNLRGKPVLLNFWATWCVPCRAEMPDLQFESRRFADSAQIIGVDEGEPVDVIRQFVTEIGVSYPIWRDPSYQVEGILKAPGLPYSIVIGKDGRVRNVRIGIMVRSYIDDQLRRSLAAD